MPDNPQKNCPECGEKIIGRSDKRFCNDSCRNLYNYGKSKDTINLIRNTNNRLKKNYNILKRLTPSKKSKTTRNTLISLGFDFNLFTSLYTTKKGTVYYFIYDIGYLPLDNDYYALVKRD